MGRKMFIMPVENRLSLFLSRMFIVKRENFFGEILLEENHELYVFLLLL